MVMEVVVVMPLADAVSVVAFVSADTYGVSRD